MHLLTVDAWVVCAHELGRISLMASQTFCTVSGRPLLVQPDPEGRPIASCPNIGPTIKPCLTTLKVTVGYSDWIRIGGSAVCLDTLSGLTDGTPPGAVRYKVNAPGQQLVSEGA